MTVLASLIVAAVTLDIGDFDFRIATTETTRTLFLRNDHPSRSAEIFDETNKRPRERRALSSWYEKTENVSFMRE